MAAIAGRKRCLALPKRQPPESTQKMKILCLAAQFPYAKVDHSGGTDLYYFLAELARRGHEICLVSFIWSHERAYVEDTRRFCSELIVVPYRSIWRKVVESPGLLFRPRAVVAYQSSAMRQALSEILSRRSFDLVYIQHLHMAQYLDLIEKSPARPKAVLDEVDVYSLVAYRNYRKASTLLEKAFYLFDWVKTHTFEMDACRRADLILVRSEKDAQIFRLYEPSWESKIAFGPTWFEGLARFSDIRPEMAEMNNLLFLGAMNRQPNIEAALHFYHHIFPLIRQEVPEAIFYIVGSSPPPEIKSLSKDEHVVVTGYVEDIKPYYARCRVFVAPLTVGGGIIVKILDAMAAGRPVVASSIGNEGIGAAPGREIFLADSPEEFAKRTVELLRDGKLWERIAANSKAFVRERYDWGRTMDELEGACLALVNGSPKLEVRGTWELAEKQM